MKQSRSNLITRRQALVSLATISAGAIIKPSSIFCSPVKDKIRFAVIGDWGSGDSDQVNTAKQMFASHQRDSFDFIISAGDNIYPNGSGRYFGRNFEQPFSDLLKERVKFYAVLGNHDVESGRKDQLEYPLFNMVGQSCYKIERGQGLADFFMLDSTDFGATQTTWLESSLRDSKAKWKIAVFHHPIYSSGKKHGSATGLRRILEPMFTRYGVQVAFSGHDHIYERTVPQQGIQYFVSGAGGRIRHGDVDLGSRFRAASYDESSHFMLIEVDDKQVSFQAVNEAGAVVDNGLIKQV
ncbi:MAG TPA: metallophosphoesterase [Blastocatellia bacterium]|nr:metallophosphoesterase [Blastocatellia bacterium]